MRRITCIFNPKAGEGRLGLTPVKLQKRIKKQAREDGIKIDVDLKITEHAGHCTDLAEECREDGLDIVVAVGGDGTVNEAVNALAEHKGCALGIIPAGSGNDASRSNIFKDPIQVHRIICIVCVDENEVEGVLARQFIQKMPGITLSHFDFIF